MLHMQKHFLQENKVHWRGAGSALRNNTGQ